MCYMIIILNRKVIHNLHKYDKHAVNLTKPKGLHTSLVIFCLSHF